MKQTNTDFPSALAKGSGRAMLLLKAASNTDELMDDLLGACLQNLAYDPQSEHERGAYLARLIVEFGDREGVFTTLAAALENADETEVHISQLFDVLVRIAPAGDEPKRRFLREWFSGLSFDDQMDCMDALVRLDGLPALIRCAERLYAESPDEYWGGEHLLEALQERDGSEAVQVIRQARAESPSIEWFLAQLEVADQSAPDSEVYDFADIRAGLKLGKRTPGAWVRRLTEAEWRCLAEDLETQTDRAHVLIYLSLFRARPFPGDIQLLIRWMSSEDTRLSWRAMLALQRVKSPTARVLALQYLAEGRADGLRLLTSNYEPGDLLRIAPLLRSTVEDEEAHALGLAILGVVGENDVPIEEIREPLLWLYEQTPCSLCRSDAVLKLHEAGQVPEWMAEECRFDAVPDTVQLFMPLGQTEILASAEPCHVR